MGGERVYETRLRLMTQLLGTPQSRADAERSARDLLRATWGDDLANCTLPVDPFFIAGQLGILVMRVELAPDVSGMLAKRAGEDPEVFINLDDSRTRQRFSCAHEIGHYMKRVTGRDDDAWGYIDRRGPSASRGDNPEEIYANQFAAELLMPEESVRRLQPNNTAAAMAIRFQVSVGAMRFRLENLGLPTT